MGASDNIQLLSHIPLGATISVGDVEVEQELSRPYVYVSRLNYRTVKEAGFHIIAVGNPKQPRLIYQWHIENPELHTGLGGTDGHYFKLRGRYYYVQAFQFGQTGPDKDLGAVVFDVTESDYSAGLMVFEGTPTADSLVTCGPGIVGLHAQGGQTYYVMAFSDTAVNGGNLVLSLKKAPTPRAHVTLSKRGLAFHGGAGAARIHGMGSRGSMAAACS